MARAVNYLFQPAQVAVIAALQTATSLDLNGLFSNQAMAPWAYATLSGFARPVTLTSANNLGALNVTILGSSYSGLALSQTISGPSGNTVSTTTQFMTVTSISAPTVMTAISAGIGPGGTSRPFVCNPWNVVGSIGLQATVSGVLNYTIQQTFDNVQTVASPTYSGVATLSSATTNLQGTITVPPRAIQIVVNSSAATGGASFVVSPTGK